MFSNVKAARLLGWTSLAVGLTELVGARWLEDELGVENRGVLIRSFGLREIAAGATLLAQPGLNQALANGLWARVAGDAVDLAALALATKSSRNQYGIVWIGSIVLAITGIDLLFAARVQHDLKHATDVAEKARLNVERTNAIPNRGRASEGQRGLAEPVVHQ